MATQQTKLSMREYLDKNIKDIMSDYPRVTEILDEYGIGCGPCTLGTCLLKDIVDIHALDPEQETALMAEIAEVISPGREVEIPRIERKSKPSTGKATYSPPMKELVDEHKLIKRWVALIPAVIENLDVDTESGRQIIEQGIDFIRSYADKFHHAKEEDILFKYFDENLDILKTMHADHETGRARVREMIAALDRRDAETIADGLRAYRELLTEHIDKEDDILYPWMDRNLSMTQIGEMYSSFQEKDREFGDTPAKHEKFISELEHQYNPQEESK